MAGKEVAVKKYVVRLDAEERRIDDQKTLARQIGAWQDHRNKHHPKANWQFTTADARVKLKRLYPQFEIIRPITSVPAPWCCAFDEKSQIQALDRTQPGLPIK